MSSATEIDLIRRQLGRIRELCGQSRLSEADDRVSGWSPAEHLDHLLKVTASVLARLQSTEALPSKINLQGRVILALRWIPRGKAKSPARLTGMKAEAADLTAAITRVETALGVIDPRATDQARIPIVPHPRFGGLTPTQALRFTAVHNAHHLKIVDDILRASAFSS